MAAPLQSLETTKIGEFYPRLCPNPQACEEKNFKGKKLTHVNTFHLNTWYLRIKAISKEFISVRIFHYTIETVTKKGVPFLIDDDGKVYYENDYQEESIKFFVKKPKITDQKIVKEFQSIQGDHIPNELMERLKGLLLKYYNK